MKCGKVSKISSLELLLHNSVVIKIREENIFLQVNDCNYYYLFNELHDYIYINYLYKDRYCDRRWLFYSPHG